MPATTNKHRLLNQILSTLPKDMEVPERNGKAEPRPVLEQFIFAICREGTTAADANRAFRNLQENFFDWNEIRVSSVRELADSLGDLPRRDDRAQRIIGFLQEVFETTFSFDLESLHKKGLKLAAKQLARYQSANDYSIAWVVQRSLGGHAIPLDGPTLRVLRRAGLVEHGSKESEVRSSMEHQIPKAKGSTFTEILSNLADAYCQEKDPLCSRCPLAKNCPKMVESNQSELVQNAS